MLLKIAKKAKNKLIEAPKVRKLFRFPENKTNLDF